MRPLRGEAVIYLQTIEGEIALSLPMIQVQNPDWRRNTVMGNCGHGVSLFSRCFGCICADNLQRYEEMRRERDS